MLQRLVITCIACILTSLCNFVYVLRLNVWGEKMKADIPFLNVADWRLVCCHFSGCLSHTSTALTIQTPSTSHRTAEETITAIFETSQWCDAHYYDAAISKIYSSKGLSMTDFCWWHLRYCLTFLHTLCLLFSFWKCEFLPLYNRLPFVLWFANNWLGCSVTMLKKCNGQIQSRHPALKAAGDLILCIGCW